MYPARRAPSSPQAVCCLNQEMGAAGSDRHVRASWEQRPPASSGLEGRTTRTLPRRRHRAAAATATAVGAAEDCHCIGVGEKVGRGADAGRRAVPTARQRRRAGGGGGGGKGDGSGVRGGRTTVRPRPSTAAAALTSTGGGGGQGRPRGSRRSCRASADAYDKTTFFSKSPQNFSNCAENCASGFPILPKS